MQHASLPSAGTANRKNSCLDLAIAHLNAPTGPVLTREELCAALRSGSLAILQRPIAAALVSYLFVELPPELISRCAIEAGSDVRHANELYRETLHVHVPRSIQWERSVEHLL